jgi:ferric enterobactin receptor
LVILFLPAYAWQNQTVDTFRISGKLQTPEGEGLDNATVVLFKSGNDSVPLKMVSSDSTGQFQVLLSSPGYYRLKATFTGFSSLELDSIFLSETQPHKVLQNLTIAGESFFTLAEAVVIHHRPQFENKDGVITMNVDAVPSAAGSSSAELLQNMPMVSTDPEGRLLVRGKQPVVLVDEKPVEMGSKELADFLESLPGSSIEKIELMQHPPPQFANSEGGVINIVTKKGIVGWMGKFTLMAGTIGQKNANANLNYRGRKITLNLVAGVNIAQISGSRISYRQNQFRDSSNQFNTQTLFANQNDRPNFRLQGSYDISNRSQWSLLLQGSGNWQENESLTTFTNINRFGDIWRISNRSNNTVGHNYSFQTQVGYTWQGTNNAEKLQVIATYTPGNSMNNRLFFQEFLSPELEKTGVDSMQGQANRNIGGNGSLRINYTKPLKKKGFTFATGASVVVTHQHNVLQTLYYDKDTRQPIVSDLLSTDNRFRQQVWSVRSGLNARIAKNWQANANLQLEGTHFDFRYEGATATAPTRNDFINFLPSVTLRRDLNKFLKTSLVYRKTVRRAGMGELNPAIDYSDPYNLRFGNPFLLPSQSHNFDLNLNWNKGKSFINGTLGYNRVKDIINRIKTLMPNGSTYATFQNIANRTEYEAGVWSGYTFSRKWRMNLSASYMYNAYGEKEKELLKFRNGSNVTFNLNGNYQVLPVLTFDGSFRFNAIADPQGRSRSNLGMQFGAQYKMLSRRLILAVAAIDPFTRQEITTMTDGPNFSVQAFSTAITRNFRFSASWALQQKKK